MILFVVLFAPIGTFAQQPQGPQEPAQATEKPAQAATPLTLAQAEATALRNNPQITIGKLRALQAQQSSPNSRQVEQVIDPSFAKQAVSELGA